MHENIKEYFGKEWLRKQKEVLMDELYSFGRVNVHIAFISVNNALDKIDKIIEKIKRLEGFDKWLKEISNAKREFRDLLFELYCFDNLNFTKENVILKPENSRERGLEALLKTTEKDIYIEMLNLQNVKTPIEKRVRNIFNKANEKFIDKDGILFVGISNFNNIPSNSPPYILLDPEIDKIKNEIIKRFDNRPEKRLDAIVLVNIFWVNNPNLLWAMFLDKRFILIPKPEEKGGPSKVFLDSIFKSVAFL